MTINASAKSCFGVIALATILLAMPISVQAPDGKIGGTSIALNTAVAADMAVAPRRTVVARRRFAAGYGRLYDAVCDGPYVGGGWNGGAYYGGPFIDLRCYGQLPWGPPPAVSYWWW